MEAWHQGRAFQYAVVFLGTGLVAVAVKALGDASQSRLAGVVAMLPIKILATWLILGGVLGSRGIHDSTTGMLAGLVAIVTIILATRFASLRLGPAAAVAVGVVAWAGALVVVEVLRRRGVPGG